MNDNELKIMSELKEKANQAEKKLRDFAFEIAEKYRKFNKGDIVECSGLTYVVDSYDPYWSNFDSVPKPFIRYILFRVNKKSHKKTKNNSCIRENETYLTLVKKAEV